VCKKCQKNIGEGALRVGILMQSRFFDGVTPTWNHLDCALKQAGGRITAAVRPKSLTMVVITM